MPSKLDIRFTIATSFDGTIEYRLEPLRARDEAAAYRLTVDSSGGYAAGSHTIVLPGERLTTLLQLIDQARIPMTADGPLGLDGSTCTLAVQAGFTRLQCTWWQDVPEAWKDVGVIAREIVRLAATHPQEQTSHD